jgi:mannose-6-phosphate isomerase-like protein (cupin superfamily)
MAMFLGGGMKVIAASLLLVFATPAFAQERTVDPTFLRANLAEVKEQPTALSSPTARYKAIFGEAAPSPAIVKGVSRYGELTVAAGGRSSPARYAGEEHILVVLEGSGSVTYGGRPHPVRANDFLYIPPGVEFAVGAGGAPLRTMVMGFRIPAGTAIVTPASLQIANIDDVRLQTVGNHPVSTLYRLLMGDTKSTRDRIAAGHIMKSLYVMEFDPGGTNFPHHHEHEEEIYILLDGEGEMVAGSGMNGIEGKYPARPGDAYFYRANATVGFYNSSAPGAKKARILAVRSTAPLRKEGG